ncbi:hypothetical protein M3Y97_00162800 [Aphelenchoides bicaudatus]|nr:hypothetical protein M3Y97_00162800 [Aphelenchoides bicaudatus]
MGLSIKILCILLVCFLATLIEGKQQKKHKPWIKSPSSGSHNSAGSKLIGRKFTRRALEQLLAKKAQLVEYKKQMGTLALTKKDDEHFSRARSLHAKRTKNRNLRRKLEIPHEFDARKQWPNCESIKIIQDQSFCGGCWAVASASAFSDRACISTNGQKQPQLSAIDLISCCSKCQSVKGDGCRGGMAAYAWEYFQTNGVTTGGKYNSHVGCKPYPFAPKNSPMNDGNSRSTQCSSTCENGKNYNSEKHYGTGSVVYSLSPEEIQQEIYANGPVVLYISVFEDLLTYKSGIYYHTTGGEVGAHSVKAIGWGEENNVPYWLIANSWGEQWGDNGFFKIVRDVLIAGRLLLRESFSDRICIASKGRHQVQISSTDLTNCCENCFSPGSRNGCTGGYPLKAWKHLIKHGAVTGSSYRDHSGCIPYEFPSCNPDAETHTIDEGCQHDGYQTGQCRMQCQSGHYRPYNKDKYYAHNIVHPKTIHEIQLELMEHGPLEMRMHAFEDLINYSSGIYYHRYGGSIGTHSVRLVGWGEQDGVPYWLIANSWNSAWGIENGFFKIVRGTNHCGIESEILAGSVDLKRLPH